MFIGHGAEPLTCFVTCLLSPIIPIFTKINSTRKTRVWRLSIRNNMKKSKTSRFCSNIEVELDRISNLPSEVIEEILSHMPIRDAVRTSVFSTKWRYKSAMLPHLVFDEQSVLSQHQTLPNVVDHVLSSHIGPLHKFKLTSGHVLFKDMDRWILQLSKNSIKELVLHYWGARLYKVPSAAFSCQALTHLELHRCSLQPPSTFTGFKSLKSLELKGVALTETMIVGCPLLERLTVLYCETSRQLNIDAPNLQVLKFIGDIEDVNFVNTSNLVDVYISKLDEFVQGRGSCMSSNLLKVFSQLPKIHRLRMNHKFMKYLAVNSLLEKMPKPCLHLQFLSVTACFEDVMDVITVYSLLRISPGLKELEVIADGSKAYEAKVRKVIFSVEENQSCLFTQLRHVKIWCHGAAEVTLDLIRFLLLTSPMLETMTVHKKHAIPLHDNDLEKMLVQYKRSSLKLGIFLF